MAHRAAVSGGFWRQICTKIAVGDRSNRHEGHHTALSRDRCALARAQARLPSGTSQCSRKGGPHRARRIWFTTALFVHSEPRSRALTCKTRLPQQTPFLVQSRFGTFPFLDTSPSPLALSSKPFLSPALLRAQHLPSLPTPFPHPWPPIPGHGPARRRARVRPHPLAPDSGAQTRRGAARQRLVSLRQVRARGSMAETTHRRKEPQ